MRCKLNGCIKRRTACAPWCRPNVPTFEHTAAPDARQLADGVTRDTLTRVDDVAPPLLYLSLELNANPAVTTNATTECSCVFHGVYWR